MQRENECSAKYNKININQSVRPSIRPDLNLSSGPFPLFFSKHSTVSSAEL